MKPNPQLSAIKNEIPIFLRAVRVGSRMGLLELCVELSALLSTKSSARLRQQWLRWCAPLSLAVPGKAAKPQQVPGIDNLASIYRAAIAEGWVAASVPGAERLCSILADEFKRRQEELATRIKRMQERSIQVLIDGLVDDYLQDDGDPSKLWHTLPVGIGQALSIALVESLKQRLIFAPPRVPRQYERRAGLEQAQLAEIASKKKIAIRKAKAYNGHANASAFAASASMLNEIAGNFAYQLTEYAKEIHEMEKLAIVQNRVAAAEFRDWEAMVASALNNDALEGAEQGAEVGYRLGDTWKTDESGSSK